jgi:hypothetical protein
VIPINSLCEQAVIQQQIALNDRMHEADKISKQLHNRTREILLGRLTKVSGVDNIIGSG